MANHGSAHGGVSFAGSGPSSVSNNAATPWDGRVTFQVLHIIVSSDCGMWIVPKCTDLTAVPIFWCSHRSRTLYWRPARTAPILFVSGNRSWEGALEPVQFSVRLKPKVWVVSAVLMIIKIGPWVELPAQYPAMASIVSRVKLYKLHTTYGDSGRCSWHHQLGNRHLFGRAQLPVPRLGLDW